MPNTTTMSSPCLNFNDLKDLHKCANDLLHSPQLQQSLVHQQHDTIISSIQEVSEASLTMLDSCGATRDIFHLVKQHLKDLQQSFRRAKLEGSHFEVQISAHGLYRKKLKKGVAKCLKDVYGMKSKCFTSDLSLIDDSLIVVVHVLREVRTASISILETLLSLLTLPTTVAFVHSQRSSRLRFMRINCQRMLERCDSMEVRMANKKVEEVISVLEKLEVELESIIRRLIQTRVLLLNLLTNKL